MESGLSDAGGLIRLCQVYQSERRFSSHPLQDKFNKVNLVDENKDKVFVNYMQTQLLNTL